MEEDWRQLVASHRPQIVLKIKQKLENLVAPGGDDAARETKLNHIATQFETMQWRDASTRHDYTERITKKLKELEAQVPAAVPAPAVTAAQLQEAQQYHRERALQEQAQREAHRRRQQEDAGKLMQQHQAQAAAQLQAQQAHQERHRAQQQQQEMMFRREQVIKQQREQQQEQQQQQQQQQQQHEQAMKLQPQLQPPHQGAREALAVPLPVPPLPVGRAIGPPQPPRKQPPQPGQPSLLTSSGQPVEAPRYRALGEAGVSHASSAAAPQLQPVQEDPVAIDARYWQVQARLVIEYGDMVSQLYERFVQQDAAGGSRQKNLAFMAPIMQILSEDCEAATVLKTQFNVEEIRKVFEVLKKTRQQLQIQLQQQLAAAAATARQLQLSYSITIRYLQQPQIQQLGYTQMVRL